MRALDGLQGPVYVELDVSSGGLPFGFDPPRSKNTVLTSAAAALANGESVLHLLIPQKRIGP
ncbi:UNVERIFIED_CONTAM: hypothetical protein Sradi_6641300 [Sesamum radiatum]|uniref:Uncharacterized protein n=1 Tax=Sesamum radiatum TaxID=300843 RepID=A0AAW2K1M0_SESRA